MTTCNLTVVKPETITPGMLVSTNVPEDDYPEWDGVTSWDTGDRVIVLATHSVYQSLIDGNVNNDPQAAVAEPKWVRVGPTNRWRLFDTSISSQTANPSTIEYVLATGMSVTFLQLLNATAVQSVQVVMTDPTYGEVYNETIDLTASPLSANWWAWFFGERRTPTQAAFPDMPGFPNAQIRVTITGLADLAVGTILLGVPRTFAKSVRMGARVGIQDYSRKERTEFGDTVVVQRAFARRANVSLLLNRPEVDEFNNFMAEVRATPCLWVATDSYEATTIYGFYKFFEVMLAYPEHADCDLELEGLT